MDDFNFVIEGDVLYCNQISKTEKPNVFHIAKVPIISKDAFMKCFEEWVGGVKNDATAK